MLPLILASVVLGAALGCGEDGELPTGPDAIEAPQLAATAATVVFRSISAGNDHSCGVTTSNVAYCWGHNFYGELGNGTSTGPETCSSFSVDFPCSTKPVAVVGAS